MQAELGRANSNGSVRSFHSRNDDYARAPVESWTPVGDYDRPPSSAYTGSMIIEDRSQYISPFARLDCSRVHTLEDDKKVMRIGRIHPDALPSLEELWRQASE